MVDPENHTLHLLRELRGDIAALDRKLDHKIDALDKKFEKKIDLLDNKIDLLDRKGDRNHEELKQRIERLRKAAFGESVLGQYTVAEVEERLDAIEGRLSALEQRR